MSDPWLGSLAWVEVIVGQVPSAPSCQHEAPYAGSIRAGDPKRAVCPQSTTGKDRQMSIKLQFDRRKFCCFHRRQITDSNDIPYRIFLSKKRILNDFTI